MPGQKEGKNAHRQFNSGEVKKKSLPSNEIINYNSCQFLRQPREEMDRLLSSISGRNCTFKKLGIAREILCVGEFAGAYTPVSSWGVNREAMAPLGQM